MASFPLLITLAELNDKMFFFETSLRLFKLKSLTEITLNFIDNNSYLLIYELYKNISILVEKINHVTLLPIIR